MELYHGVVKEELRQHLDYLTNKANNLVRKYIQDHRQVSLYSDAKYHIVYDNDLNVFYVTTVPDYQISPLITYSKNSNTLNNAIKYFDNVFRSITIFNNQYALLCNCPSRFTARGLEEIMRSIKENREYLESEPQAEERVEDTFHDEEMFEDEWVIF